MAERIALFGGSFNPPGMHHRLVVERLLQSFERVVIIPCGFRPDKETTNDVEPIHRAVMADLAFGDLPGAEVVLDDLEQGIFTRTHQLDQIYREQGEVWHVVGGDLIKEGKDRRSVIQREWQKGPQVWQDCNFAVVARPGYRYSQDDLPPHNQMMTPIVEGSSSEIRQRAFNHLPYGDLVTARVAQYIERYALYRGRPPYHSARFSLEEPRPFVFCDTQNSRACELARGLDSFPSPNCILVLGGDGTMLRAIREHWRLRLPFIGINLGHYGFKLNEDDGSIIDGDQVRLQDLVIRNLPLLYVQTSDSQGSVTDHLAFNDVWIERQGGQTAWIEVAVDKVVRLHKLVGDGVLIATAAGSTAYASAMGASALPVDAPVLIMAGSNVFSPAGWKVANLPLEADIELRGLDTGKRPLDGFVDGEPLGEVVRLCARISRTASAEVAFVPTYDIAEKLTRIQFPEGG